MSSIWDPADPPEVIEAQREAAAEKAAREALAAERAARVEAEAKVARMRAMYARAAACSLLDPEDRGPDEQAPESTAREVVPAPPDRSSRSPRLERALENEETARREFHAKLRASISPALAAWRPGLPIPPLDPPSPPRLEYARTTDSYGVAVSTEEGDRRRSSTAPRQTANAGPYRVVVFHPTARSGGGGRVPAALRGDRSRRTLPEGNAYRSILEREARPPTPPKGLLGRVANWIRRG